MLSNDTILKAQVFAHGKGIKYWRTIERAKIIVETGKESPRVIDHAECALQAAARQDLRAVKGYAQLLA